MWITQTTLHNHHTGQIAQKEKSHVVDYHRNPSHPVAARFPGRKYKPKVPAYRQLDPCFARYRSRPGRIERIGNCLGLHFVEIRSGQPTGLPTPFTLHE